MRGLGWAMFAGPVPRSLGVVGLHSLGLGLEGRPRLRLECYQVRPRRARKAELELLVVVYGIERAQR